jgi:hypothetical protein
MKSSGTLIKNSAAGLTDRGLGRTKSHGSHDHDEESPHNTLTQPELWPVGADYTHVYKYINYVRKYGIQNLRGKKSDLHSKQILE